MTAIKIRIGVHVVINKVSQSSTVLAGQKQERCANSGRKSQAGLMSESTWDEISRADVFDNQNWRMVMTLCVPLFHILLIRVDMNVVIHNLHIRQFHLQHLL